MPLKIPACGRQVLIFNAEEELREAAVNLLVNLPQKKSVDFFC
jgi:hypothetical protein